MLSTPGKTARQGLSHPVIHKEGSISIMSYITLYVEDAPRGGSVRVPARSLSLGITTGVTIADICERLCEEAAA